MVMLLITPLCWHSYNGLHALCIQWMRKNQWHFMSVIGVKIRVPKRYVCSKSSRQNCKHVTIVKYDFTPAFTVMAFMYGTCGVTWERRHKACWVGNRQWHRNIQTGSRSDKRVSVCVSYDGVCSSISSVSDSPLWLITSIHWTHF